MKKILSFCAFVLIATLMVAGCAKVPESPIESGMMTANADGGFNASSCIESFVLSGTEDYYITGKSTDRNSSIIIRIRTSKLQLGTYYFDGTQEANTAWYISNNNTMWASSGSVTIASDSAGVATSGTFTFNALHGPVVSGGSFRAIFR